MAKAKKNMVQEIINTLFKDSDSDMKKVLKEEYSRPLYDRITTLFNEGTASDNPFGNVKKVIKLLGKEFERLKQIDTRREVFKAYVNLVNGGLLIKTKKLLKSTPKKDRENLNWIPFLRKYLDQWSVRSCQEWMDLTGTPEIHPYAEVGYTNMRDIHRVFKKLKEKKFNKFVRQHKLEPKDIQGVSQKEFKSRLATAAKDEEIWKKTAPSPPAEKDTKNQEGSESNKNPKTKSGENDDYAEIKEWIAIQKAILSTKTKHADLASKVELYLSKAEKYWKKLHEREMEDLPSRNTETEEKAGHIKSYGMATPEGAFKYKDGPKYLNA